MTDLLDAVGLAAPAPIDRATATSVLIVEDDELIAHAVTQALRAAGVEAETCRATSSDRIVEEVRAERAPVVLLDVLHAGCGDGAPELVRSLRALGVEVLAFTDSTDRLLLGAVVEAGASDVVSPLAPVHELVDAVRHGLRGESRLGVSYRQVVLQQLCRERAEQRARLAPFLALTRREAAVLAQMMEGHPAETIATACFVSVPTVRSQIRAILTKLGVKSQLAAVARAYRAGWSLDAHQPALSGRLRPNPMESRPMPGAHWHRASHAHRSPPAAPGPVAGSDRRLHPPPSSRAGRQGCPAAYSPREPWWTRPAAVIGAQVVRDGWSSDDGRALEVGAEPVAEVSATSAPPTTQGPVTDPGQRPFT